MPHDPNDPSNAALEAAIAIIGRDGPGRLTLDAIARRIPSLRGALATEQSRIFPRRDSATDTSIQKLIRIKAEPPPLRFDYKMDALSSLPETDSDDLLIPVADEAAVRCAQLLANAGMRATRHRLALGKMLLLGDHRHVTAEGLYDEALAANLRLSLATVYNTLNQFTEAGLLRRIAADGIKSFFDTDTSVHPHFYLEGEDTLVDVAGGLAFSKLPDALPGHEIARLDVIVHLRRKRP